MCLMDSNQTKHIHHHPWCGDNAYALGWGVIKPQAMVEAKVARHHVTPVLLNNCVTEGGFGPSTILRRIMYHRKSCNKILLKLVQKVYYPNLKDNTMAGTIFMCVDCFLCVVSGDLVSFS